MFPLLPFVFVTWLSITFTNVHAYDLVREHSGRNFFNGWEFYGNWDNLTLGDAWWLNEPDAWNQGLVSINQLNRPVIKVDDKTDVPWNIKRNSIRITSRDTYNFGSLWIIDVVHIPYGCSVWPAFWSLGRDWPVGGEIDIIEGINLMNSNQAAVHTVNGCIINSPTPQNIGRQLETNCSTPSGCTILDSRPYSFGEGFARNGGGVWATQFDVEGIFIWFWPRDRVPSDINQRPLDISRWGTPSASYPNSPSCPMTQYFSEQRLIIDITLCGVWAGNPPSYDPTCKNSGTGGNCYLNNVIGSGHKYKDAYFEINYLKAFTTAPPSATHLAAQSSASSRASNDVGKFNPILAVALFPSTIFLLTSIVYLFSWL